MRVRIKELPHSKVYWIRNRVGQVFDVEEVEESYPRLGRVVSGEHKGNSFRFDDAVIVDSMVCKTDDVQREAIVRLLMVKGIDLFRWREHSEEIYIRHEGNRFTTVNESLAKYSIEISFNDMIYLILSLPDAPKSVIVELNSKYEANVYSDGKIEVGCQTFDIKDVQNIVKAWESLQ